MSVIENAIKRLQAARGTAPPALDRGPDAPQYRPEPQAPIAPARTISINPDALRAAGLLPPPHQERELAQQYRQIKRPLINSALGRGTPRLPQGNLLLVASAVPGEGKTFISLNLALSMRLEEDVTVLLVDGDVVNPRVTQVLGQAEEPGLLDVIRDPALSVDAAIVATDVPGLSFLPAGRPDDKATELLASARMQQVVTQLGERDPRRLVLFDSAPLLLTTESQALAQIAGQILIVVRADQTPQHVVLEAIETLGENKPVALVLNQSMRQPPMGYYYQYGSAGRAHDASGA
jgi:protein-tyrosine kinase